jgi:hypothetical protein
MKKLFTFLFLASFALVVSATTTPVKPAEKMNQTKQVVTDQLFKLQEIDRILEAENLTYAQLAEKYPDLLEETPVTPVMEEGVFDKASDSPLGIPGFWWGFCLGWVGMLIVYLMMDEGQDRKDQVKKALIGCIIGSIIGLGIYFLAWGSLLWWGDAGKAVSTAITAGC